ncbi:hypothetical protein [Leisingera caerulea]|uniref:hypothetical protein n=1 Tax=Leisingera caerulea TaxID=506591 RepID=UPI0021A7342C|nr:hypothetical protein [Leisingera caerulea]UWQ82929.1 hypothetical protein K3726_14805 [Leisingera caerulea]
MTYKTKTDRPATQEELERDTRLLAKLTEQLPAQTFIARLSESDIQDNIPFYLEEIEAAAQKAKTVYVSEVAKQAITTLRNAAGAGDIRQGVNNAFMSLNKSWTELRRKNNKG